MIKTYKINIKINYGSTNKYCFEDEAIIFLETAADDEFSVALTGSLDRGSASSSSTMLKNGNFNWPLLVGTKANSIEWLLWGSSVSDTCVGPVRRKSWLNTTFTETLYNIAVALDMDRNNWKGSPSLAWLGTMISTLIGREIT